LAAFCTLLLVIASGLVSSRDAGFTLPDWSLSSGGLISWAPIATAVILWISLRILLHYAHNRELRPASLALPGITFRQFFPGMGAYMSRIACADAVQPAPAREFAAPRVASGTK
jgi:hypothetical protein